MTPEHIQKLKKQWNAIKRIRGGVMAAGYSTGDGKSFCLGTDEPLKALFYGDSFNNIHRTHEEIERGREFVEENN